MAKRDYNNTKTMQLPEKYHAGFLKDFDKRTEVYQQLNSAFQELLCDLGGIENLSHVKIAMVERFIFLEFAMRNLEQRIAESPKKTGKLFGRWVQSINALSGLAKTLGLDRKAKSIESDLKSYISKKKKKKVPA